MAEDRRRLRGQPWQRSIQKVAAVALLFSGVTGWTQTGSSGHVQPAVPVTPEASGTPATPTGTSAATTAAAASAAGVVLQPPPAGFDLQARGHEVLSELSDVVRYFRMAVTPIQKVGEPSDLLYREQALAQATQVADLAFQSAKAEATLLAAYQRLKGAAAQPSAEGEAQKLQTVRANVAQRLIALKAQQDALEAQLGKAKAKQRPALEQQKEQVDGAIELTTAMSDSLGKIVSLSGATGTTGLAGDIDRLQRSTPELAASKAKTVVPAPLENLSSARSAGVSSQASVLFQLLSTRHEIDTWVGENQALHDSAVELRTPLTQIVRGLTQSGQALSQQAQNNAQAVTAAPGSAVAEAPSPLELQDIRKRYDSVTATFKVVSAAIVPLSQEIIMLEQSRANLLAWRAAVDEEYSEVLRLLLIRVAVIALLLGLVFVLGEVWRRATTRYVHDLRRRRQLLVMRRMVTGFLSGLILIFGFVTQFSSLATFAGFITAGLAVGLQTILLSVAAYFFIVGRYGVRVGDRISVAGVTGDVIDVGLVRFYMLELAGSGTELQPTGRVAVFSNAVLFQAGTPLYKQLPGADYAWHELTMKLSEGSDYAAAAKELSAVVQQVYEGYRSRIEAQYRDVQVWMDATLAAPTIDSRLQLVDGGLQLSVRYPVEIRNASAIDQQVTQQVLEAVAKEPVVHAAVSAPPSIRSIVKG